MKKIPLLLLAFVCLISLFSCGKFQVSEGQTDIPDSTQESGMTWVISLKYENGDTLTIYHFGNMFIRSEKGSWYKMTHEEANRFDTLLDELNN